MVVKLEGGSTSLPYSWLEWETKIVEFSKVESATRPAMRKILEELEADHSDHTYSAGIYAWKIDQVNA